MKETVSDFNITQQYYSPPYHSDCFYIDCGTPCTPPLIVVVGHYAQLAAVGGAGA